MDCQTFSELSISDWVDETFLPLNGNRYPISGTIELTDRCNYNCVHCYINQPAGSQEAKQSELSTTQVLDILDQISDAGCLFLLLTGGEIFLRPDFKEIYLHAKRRGMLLSLFTNGAIITQELADMLALYPPQSIEITMYGATRDTYEAVTRVPGSYGTFCKAVDMLLDRGLRLTLKTVLLTVNIHEFTEMRTFVENRGLKFRYDAILWPRLDGNRTPLQYQIPIEEIVALDINDPERKEAWEFACKETNGYLVREKHIFNCGAGMHNFHINSQGSLTMCNMARLNGYDLKQMRFAEAWQQMGDQRELERKLSTPCQTCTLGALCNQCPGWSQLIHGDNETPVEFICQLAHLRAKQMAFIEV